MHQNIRYSKLKGPLLIPGWNDLVSEHKKSENLPIYSRKKIIREEPISNSEDKIKFKLN